MKVSQGKNRISRVFISRSKQYQFTPRSVIASSSRRYRFQAISAAVSLWLGALLTAVAAQGAETARLVIFDNDFLGPAGTNLQAAALPAATRHAPQLTPY
jgi:hypothetical protein